MPAARKRLVLAASILGSTVVFVDGTVINVALPALREDFDAGLVTQQWVIEAYLLTLSALLLLGGSLGDMLGRRRVFEAGLAGFGVASLMCASAPSDELLVAFRAIQGVAGALLVPSSLALITATFEGEERGAAIGSWTAWTGIGIIIGPLVGGALVDAASWRWIFALNLPLLVLAIVLIRRALPYSERGRGDLDLVGAGLATVGLAGVVFALIEQPEFGWGDPLVLGPLAVGAAALVAFVVHERRASNPMVPLALFRVRAFAVANVATLAIYAGLSASGLFLTLYLQQVVGYSALQSGLVWVPVTVLMFTMSRRAGLLSRRIGSRFFMTAGPLLAGAGLLLMLRVGERPDYVADILPGILAFGVGLTLTVAPLTATVLAAVDERRAGIASGVNNAVARVAGLVSIAAVGAIVSGQFSSTLDDRLAGQRLEDTARSAVEDARSRPLVESTTYELPASAREQLEPALASASVDALHAGLVASAALLIAGGAVSGVALEKRRRGVAILDDDGGRANGTSV